MDNLQKAHPRGRPRSVEAEAAIIDATLDLIVEWGVSALSVEAVAARAGVGKATIYRRWPGKEELVEDALSRLNDELPRVPNLPTVREQLIAMLEHLRCKSSKTRTGQILPRVISMAATQPDLMRVFFTKVIDPRRERFRSVIRGGMASGELRPDLDVELAVTMLAAPMMYLNLMQAGMDRPTASTSVALVDLVLGGIGATGGIGAVSE